MSYNEKIWENGICHNMTKSNQDYASWVCPEMWYTTIYCLSTMGQWYPKHSQQKPLDMGVPMGTLFWDKLTFSHFNLRLFGWGILRVQTAKAPFAESVG